jgi:hypothetical protein
VLTADEAAAIAREQGLTLSDAVALRQLADDPDTARQLAATFSADDTEAAILARLTEPGRI